MRVSVSHINSVFLLAESGDCYLTHCLLLLELGALASLTINYNCYSTKLPHKYMGMVRLHAVKKYTGLYTCANWRARKVTWVDSHSRAILRIWPIVDCCNTFCTDSIQVLKTDLDKSDSRSVRNNSIHSKSLAKTSCCHSLSSVLLKTKCFSRRLINGVGNVSYTFLLSAIRISL